MSSITSDVKRLVLAAAMTALLVECMNRHKRWPEGQEFEDFLDSFGANQGEILRILRDCYPERPWLVGHVGLYPAFWDDLKRNVGYESQPRSVRPALDVT